MDRADYIIANGSKIISNIFDELNTSTISDLKLLDVFFSRLLNETDGLLIVDFMDAGNWDYIGSYSIDYEKGYLTLYWQRKQVDDEIIYSDNYKQRRTSLMLHFKELRYDRIHNFPFISLQGYAVKKKEALSYLNRKNKHVTFVDERKANFNSLYNFESEDCLERCYFYDTPIYSMIILPKDTAGSTNLSQFTIFYYNYLKCHERLRNIETSLVEKNLNEDELCEKSNTIRRIFELILKIECCYQGEGSFNSKHSQSHYQFKHEYSDVLLGSLISILKDIKSEKEKMTLNSIVRLSNELSHDSGKKVEKEKVYELLNLVDGYLLANGEELKHNYT